MIALNELKTTAEADVKDVKTPFYDLSNLSHAVNGVAIDRETREAS
jgi:hypothetical protein